ncbi:unnamed protein product [Symbiodinium natans]|uniref:Uncharacterized protein n=1 Tax=Symbiodinium natans TaxID=878477 RepID=A0A812REK4_9DINO|nr:unnamed protein product [Symbiodinium natans]
MIRSATAGQALASDFLRLEAQRDALEGKQWRCLEDMENRKMVNQQRQKAYADILDRRLQAEGKQQSITKERNLVIRTEATRLCSSRSWEGEATSQIRARKERFAVEVEEMWKDWQQRVATKIREDIDVARRDAEHCKARQKEAMEAALTQERLLVDLLEAEFLAQKEREKLYEEVEEQQQRLRQRLHEERRALDERLQAFTMQPPPAGAAPGTKATPAPPSTAKVSAKPSEPTTPTARQAAAEAPVTASKACGRAASKNAGFVPKAGTRHFEVYQQLRRSEMEMQADLRLLEDRKVLHCLHCGSTQAAPGPPSGLCETCGHFTELIQLPPQVARGPAVHLNAPQPRTSAAMAQALRLRPAPPALASRGPTTIPDSDDLVTQPALLSSRPCPSRISLESRRAEVRRLLRQDSDASPFSPLLAPRLPTPREMLPADGLQTDSWQADGRQADGQQADFRIEAGADLPEALPPLFTEESREPELPKPFPHIVVQEIPSPSIRASPDSQEEFGGVPTIGQDLGPEASGEILGSLGILEMPLGPLLAPAQPPPRAVALSSAVRSGDNDWYGSSTSGTPRKEEEGPKNAVPASETSAEDLFLSGQHTPRELEEKPAAEQEQRPAASQVAENATPTVDAVLAPGSSLSRTADHEEAEDTEELDLDAMIPFSAREKAQRQTSPYLPVVEQPQAPIDHRKPKEAATSPEGSSLGSLASPEAPQEASAGSFSFGDQGQHGLGSLGEASPLEEKSAKGDVTGSSVSHVSKAPVPIASASNGQGGGTPATRPTAGILRDLGLDESSDDTPKDSKEEAQPASASSASLAYKATPKRSNPLRGVAAGRGNLLQGSTDFLGGGIPGLGRSGPGRDGSSGGALSSLAALRPKSKARPKIGSLPGGPIDWSQREDFR